VVPPSEKIKKKNMPLLDRVACSKGRTAALLIGINYTGSSSALRGCENDVSRMERWLLDERGFADVEVMTEHRGRPPTAANIKAALTELAAKTLTGVDKVVIQYSGHGTHARDRAKAGAAADEPDGQDEAWVGCDLATVPDDCIRAALNAMSPWTRVFLLIDACHSGSSADLPLLYVYGHELVSIESQTAPVCDAVMFSGSKDTQTSADFDDPDTGLATGAMTDAFFDNLDQHDKLVRLKTAMHVYMQDNGLTQRPQLSTSRPLAPGARLTDYVPIQTGAAQG